MTKPLAHTPADTIRGFFEDWAELFSLLEPDFSLLDPDASVEPDAHAPGPPGITTRFFASGAPAFLFSWRQALLTAGNSWPDCNTFLHIRPGAPATATCPQSLGPVARRSLRRTRLLATNQERIKNLSSVHQLEVERRECRQTRLRA